MADKKSGAARALKRDHRKHAPAKKADKHEASKKKTHPQAHARSGKAEAPTAKVVDRRTARGAVERPER